MKPNPLYTPTSRLYTSADTTVVSRRDYIALLGECPPKTVGMLTAHRDRDPEVPLFTSRVL